MSCWMITLVGYAYSHLVCYATFLMPLVIHYVKGNTQVFTLSKNTLEVIKGSLSDDYDVQNVDHYEQLVKYVSNLDNRYGFPRDVEDFGSTDVLNDDSNEFESPSDLYMGWKWSWVKAWKIFFYSK